MAQHSASPSTILAAYLERFIEGRRVIVFGNALSALSSHLLERGARLVHVYDTDLGRIAEATARGASQEITFAPLGEQGIAVRDGAFDVGIIENLGCHEAPAEAVRRMRRALAARGILLVASPNPEANSPLISAEPCAPLTYYELFDLVSGEFDEVSMLGQTPFIGYAVASFSADNSEDFSVDTGFVSGGAEEPDWYLALGSHFSLTLDPFSVIQLGLADYRSALPPKAVDSEAIQRLRLKLDFADRRLLELEGQLAAELATDKSDPQELKQAQLALERSESALRQERLRAEEQAPLLARLQAELDKTQASLSEAQRRLEDRTARCEELESRAATADASAVETLSEPLAQAGTQPAAESSDRAELAALQHQQNEALSAELAALGQQNAALNAELSALRAQNDALNAELAAVKSSVEPLTALLGERDASLQRATDTFKDLERDCTALEAQLAARGHHLADVERRLASAEQLASELLALRADVDAEEGQSALNDDLTLLREQVQELSVTNARRLADLQAAQWTIDEMSQRLDSH